ncbi:MAG: YidC/Oxa1 family membrane protein insertase [Clostridiaceae bacterium]|nr:YidC/Oxa1 family membrane protein insertase [Clostridiaceae bacterium]
MFNFFKFIPEILGQLLLFIYDNIAFHHYGLAIIIFTVIVKVALLPLTIKQQKSSAKMQELQPLMQEIQRKYKNDREKQSQEMMKLYQEHKYNPASGCLPLLFQMPILFSLFYVIKEPFTYMFNLSAEKLEALKKSAVVGKGLYWQLEVPSNKAQEILNLKFQMEEIIGPVKFNLAKIPSWNPSVLFGSEMSTYLPLFLIPVLAIVTTYLSTKMMAAKVNKTSQKDENDTAAAMQKNMMLMAPLMTGFISFQAPAALGLYWLVGNLFQIIQQLFLNKFIIKKKEVKIE